MSQLVRCTVCSTDAATPPEIPLREARGLSCTPKTHTLLREHIGVCMVSALGTPIASSSSSLPSTTSVGVFFWSIEVVVLPYSAYQKK